jgi:hypothetical protein
MKLKLKSSNEDEPYYFCDVDRIVRIFADRGYEISHSDARLAWERYSDSMCAGWLILDEDPSRVFNSIIYYFEGWE